MGRQPVATMQLTPQNDQLMSEHRVLRFKPHLRLEWRAQDGKNEAEQPEHSIQLGNSVTAINSDEVFGTHRSTGTWSEAAEKAGLSDQHFVLSEVQVRGALRTVGSDVASAISIQRA